MCLCSRTVNVSQPEETHNNGTLYVMVFIHQAGRSPLEDSRQVHLATKMTTQMLPRSQKSPGKLKVKHRINLIHVRFKWYVL